MSYSIISILKSAENDLVKIEGEQPTDLTQATSAYSMAKSAIAQALIQRTAIKIELLKYYDSVGMDGSKLLAEIEADLEGESAL